MAPASLGRYTITRELGRGAMGRVYLAHDPEIDRPVAVKTVEAFEALPTGRQEEARRQFMAEARAAGKLLHPAIVTLFDAGESGGTLYLAMEYVEGETLDNFTTLDTLLPLDVIVDLIAATAEALDYAHRAGVIHRDIKPANLMQVGGTAIKVMDFGLAGPIEAQLTDDGSLLGTPAYMSPEHVRDKPVDGRSDLFSLAVVLYELLTARRPFAGGSVSSIIFRIVNEPPAPIGADETSDERVSPGLRAFLDHGLAKRPEDRFPDGASFAAALRSAVGDAAAPAPAAVVATGPPVAPSPSPLPSPLPDDRPSAAPTPSGGRRGRGARAARSSDPRRPRGPLGRRRRRSSAGLWLTLAALVAVAIGAAWWFRDRLPFGRVQPPPPAVLLETSVRTEPEGLEVRLDGIPLEVASAGVVRFPADGPFGTLSATRDCRTAEHLLDPLDAGGEVVLVLDDPTLTMRLDPGVNGATVRVNDQPVGKTPLDLTLDLCRENRVDLSRDGYRPATATIAAETMPVETRTLLAALSLELIPKGLLRLPRFPNVKLVWYVDGNRLPQGRRELELTEGEHVVRIKNEYHYIDERRKIDVVGGVTADAPIELPALTDLVVQAYPPNCKVYLRRPGGRWRHVDDTPFRRRVAVGEFEVRVQLNPTGESRERKVSLTAGENPPVRVSFGSR